jgi:DNA-binding NarL/FixJ family response regulator
MPSAQQSRSSAISVFIAESDHMNCQLVESIFRPKRARVKVVASAVDSNRALALVKETKPDIAVISAKLREGPLEGYRLLRALRSLQFKTRAIMLLDSREPDSVIDAFRCGAHGVVFRDEPLEILGKCIHAVHEGQVWANGLHLGYLVEALGQSMPMRLQDASGIERLSKREEDVVRLLAQGLTNKDISAKLGLSEHTVKNYLFRVYEKLGVSTRVELVLYFLQERQSQSTSAAS